MDELKSELRDLVQELARLREQMAGQGGGHANGPAWPGGGAPGFVGGAPGFGGAPNFSNLQSDYTRKLAEQTRRLNEANKGLAGFGGGVQQLGGQLASVVGALGVPTSIAGGVYAAKHAYAEASRMAAVANPQAASTADVSKKIYEAEVGRDYVSLENQRARAYQSAAKLAEAQGDRVRQETNLMPLNLATSWKGLPESIATLGRTLQRSEDQGVAGAGRAISAPDLLFNATAGRFIPKSLTRAFGGLGEAGPAPLQSFAGLGGGEQFSNMAEWSAAQQQASLRNGPAEAELLRKQQRNMMENLGGGGPDQGADTRELAAAIADLAAKVAQLQIWGR